MDHDPERDPAYYRTLLRKLTAKLEKQQQETRHTGDRNSGSQEP